ncbi:MAG: hypothetical protein JW896_15280 [Deltaproteobacteria bacterium]|nr:hypothetical protein [Deltaproteobacteria bacterium]
MEEVEYFNKAGDYLLSLEGVTEEMIDAHLSDWKNRKPRNISGLFRAFLLHAQNRQGMPNSIGNIDKLGFLLFDFQPRKVADSYTSWENLFDALTESGYKPPGPLDKGNPKSYWVIYCKSIISIANFLASYQNMDEFNTFVAGFLTNEFSRLALPLLLKEELFGFGFALACDFFKEIGYTEFVKPDTHLNDIARGLGISQAQTDFGIFKDVEAYCKRIGKLPYEVDKLFWLVGSGRFYNINGLVIFFDLQLIKL